MTEQENVMFDSLVDASMETKAQRKRNAVPDQSTEKPAKMPKSIDPEETKEIMKKQCVAFWEVAQKIDLELENLGKKRFLQKLIEANGVMAYKNGTLNDLKEILADLIIFGAPEPCPNCLTPLYYDMEQIGYACSSVFEGKKLSCYFTRDPVRKPFQLPPSLKLAHLSEYNNKIILPQRVYPKNFGDKTSDLLVGSAICARLTHPAPLVKKEALGILKDNGFVVDPYFTLAPNFHVYVENEEPYQALLHKEEKDGKTLFYKIQLLEEDDISKSKTYYIFERWGVVNQPMTEDMKTKFDDLDTAIKEFMKKFHDKTMRDWLTERYNFEAKAGKYDLVEFQGPMMGTYGQVADLSAFDLSEKFKSLVRAEAPQA